VKISALTDKNQKFEFPLITAGFMSLAILFAEHHLPKSVMFPFPVESQIEELQGSTLHEICYLLLGGVGIYWLLRHRRRAITWSNPLVIAFIALLIWCLMSVLWAGEPSLSIRRLVSLSLTLIGAAGAVAYWPRRAVVAFISVSSAFHLSIGAAAEIIAGHFRPWDSEYRFAGTLFWNQQGFCCFVLAISSVVASDIFPRYKNLYQVSALYGTLFLLLTKSRSSMMALAVCVVLYFILTRSARFKVGSILGISLAGLLLYVTGVLDYIIEIISRKGEGAESFTGRVPVWEECLQFIKVHPIVGYGYEDFWTADKVYYFTHKFSWSISAAHSGYIEGMLTLGIVGMCLQSLVLILGVYMGVKLYKNKRDHIFALAVCVCIFYLLAGGLEAIMVVKLSPYSFYFFLLLMTLCMTDTVRDEEQRIAEATLQVACNSSLQQTSPSACHSAVARISDTAWTERHKS
jgi:exopolysaccharide production protein ExoQ